MECAGDVARGLLFENPVGLCRERGGVCEGIVLGIRQHDDRRRLGRDWVRSGIRRKGSRIGPIAGLGFSFFFGQAPAPANEGRNQKDSRRSEVSFPDGRHHTNVYLVQVRQALQDPAGFVLEVTRTGARLC